MTTETCRMEKQPLKSDGKGRYPTRKPSSALATGRMLYTCLMENIHVPAQASHRLWYAGEAAKIAEPEKFAIRGNLPVGKKIELLTVARGTIKEGDNAVKTSEDTFLYTITGNEEYICVADLPQKSRDELGIPAGARDKDKVFNRNFAPYDQLDLETKFSNELAALSFAKSLSNYFGGNGKINYSEVDVLKFLQACFSDLSSPEMIHVLSGNHIAWATLAYVRSKGDVTGDISTEFYGQNPHDFYAKDLGTILPAMFFTLALLNQDPTAFNDRLDVNVWGAKEVAEYMKLYMPR